MTIQQLEQNLAEARRHLQAMQYNGTLQSADFEAVSQAERELAAAKGQEYAIQLDFGVAPEAAVSGPMLLQDDYHAFLAFNAMRPRPDGMREEAGLAIVELQGCSTTKFGYPNDEALPGHPLYRRGLGGYEIFEVLNSSWINEQNQMNKVHFPETQMRPVRHFIFTFHESTLECIATDIKVEVAPFSPQFQKIYDVLTVWDNVE